MPEMFDGNADKCIASAANIFLISNVKSSLKQQSTTPGENNSHLVHDTELPCISAGIFLPFLEKVISRYGINFLCKARKLIGATRVSGNFKYTRRLTALLDDAPELPLRATTTLLVRH